MLLKEGLSNHHIHLKNKYWILNDVFFKSYLNFIITCLNKSCIIYFSNAIRDWKLKKKLNRKLTKFLFCQTLLVKCFTAENGYAETYFDHVKQFSSLKVYFIVRNCKIWVTKKEGIVQFPPTFDLVLQTKSYIQWQFYHVSKLKLSIYWPLVYKQDSSVNSFFF